MAAATDSTCRCQVSSLLVLWAGPVPGGADLRGPAPLERDPTPKAIASGGRDGALERWESEGGRLADGDLESADRDCALAGASNKEGDHDEGAAFGSVPRDAGEHVHGLEESERDPGPCVAATGGVARTRGRQRADYQAGTRGRRRPTRGRSRTGWRRDARRRNCGA
jgi:hypothetical protein